jgi:homoserine kinase type II
MTVKFSPNVHLSNDEVQNFLNDNNLGDLRYIKLKTKGTESTTYTIRTNKNSFILNLFESSSFPNFAFDQRVSNHFTAKGFPFANILAIGQISEKPASLTQLLPGKALSEWDETHYETLGFFLGNFHLTSPTFSETSPKTPFIWQLSQLFYEIQSHIPNEFKFLEQEIFSIEEAWPLDLPKGFIHGDIWPKNILFVNDSLTGVLDFSASYEPYILDLANLIKGIPPSNRTFVSALLSGYETARPLSSKELDSLDLLVYAKTVNTILYLLKQAIHHPSRKDQLQTYAFINLLKILT